MPKKETAIVTAASAAELSFSDQLATYEKALKEKSDLEATLEKTNTRLWDFVQKFDIRVEGRRPMPSDVDKIEVYKDPAKDTSIEAKIAEREGYHFENIAGDEKTMAHLKKAFGADLTKFVKKVAAKYTAAKKDVLDEAATNKAREQFVALVTELQKNIDDLNKAEAEIKNTERYIDTVEKIANIARK